MNDLVLELCERNGYEKALKLLQSKLGSSMQKRRFDSFLKFKKQFSGKKRKSGLSFEVNIDEEIKVSGVKKEVQIPKEGLKEILICSNL